MTHLNEDKNFIDDYVKDNIRKGINIIQNTLEGSQLNKWIPYYTGYLYKDILDNFPGRTNKKIFNSYRKLTADGRLTFAQKKFEEMGYDYFVQKRVKIRW